MNLSYVDLYLIHTPFGFPESTDGEMARHPNGDVVLDLTTDHVAVWKVSNTSHFFFTISNIHKIDNKNLKINPTYLINNVEI